MATIRSRISLPRRLPRDLALELLVAVPLFVILFGASMRRERHLLTGFDLAYFTQASWSIGQGQNPFSTLRGLHVLGDHTNYVLFPIALLTKVFPAHAALLGFQAFVLAFGAVFVYLLARRVAKLSKPLAFGLAVSYALFPALQNTAMADFHPEVVALPALIGAVYFAMLRHWIRYAICIALALVCREDTAIAVLLLGAMLAIKDYRRAGLFTMLASALMLVLNLVVVLPHFAGTYEQAEKFGRYGDSLGAIAISALVHPQWVVHDLISGANPGTIVALFAPVLFLSLLAPRWLLPGIPLQLVYMLSTNVASHTIDHHYTIVINAFIYVAAVMALKDRNWPQWQTGALLVFSGLAFCATYSLIFKSTVLVDPLYGPDAQRTAISQAVKMIGPNDPVLASARIWGSLDERADLYNFSIMYEDGYHPLHDSKTLAQREEAYKWIAVDTVDMWQWEPGYPAYVNAYVATGQWHQVFSQDGIELYERC